MRLVRVDIVVYIVKEKIETERNWIVIVSLLHAKKSCSLQWNLYIYVYFVCWGIDLFGWLGIYHSTCVVFAKELHAHYSKYEDYNAQDEGQIAQSSDSATHYRYEQI